MYLRRFQNQQQLSAENHRLFQQSGKFQVTKIKEDGLSGDLTLGYFKLKQNTRCRYEEMLVARPMLPMMHSFSTQSSNT